MCDLDEIIGDFEMLLSPTLIDMHRELVEISNVCAVDKSPFEITGLSIIPFHREYPVRGFVLRHSDSSVVFMIKIQGAKTQVQAYKVFKEIEEQERDQLSSSEVIAQGFSDHPWTEFPSRPSQEYFIHRYNWDKAQKCMPFLNYSISAKQGVQTSNVHEISIDAFKEGREILRKAYFTAVFMKKSGARALKSA